MTQCVYKTRCSKLVSWWHLCVAVAVSLSDYGQCSAGCWPAIALHSAPFRLVSAFRQYAQTLIEARHGIADMAALAMLAVRR